MRRSSAGERLADPEIRTYAGFAAHGKVDPPLLPTVEQFEDGLASEPFPSHALIAT